MSTSYSTLKLYWRENSGSDQTQQ